jgi:hypothetical protein
MVAPVAEWKEVATVGFVAGDDRSLRDSKQRVKSNLKRASAMNEQHRAASNQAVERTCGERGWLRPVSALGAAFAVALPAGGSPPGR